MLKPWYLKTAWWSIISTFLLGSGGFYIALQTNIFGIQELRLETKKLQDSIIIKKEKLKDLEDSLQSSNKILNDLNDSLVLKDRAFLRLNSKLYSAINHEIGVYESKNAKIADTTTVVFPTWRDTSPNNLSSDFTKYINVILEKGQKRRDSIVRSNNHKIDSLRKIKALMKL